MTNSWQNLIPDKCDWCPLVCGANRASGEVGLCGANDKLYVARASLHYWEEPPISGIIGGPKRDQGPGSGTIFFSNCNMKCAYCQNRDISGVGNVAGKETSIDELVDMMLNLQNQGAMNINLVTGTHYRSHLITAVRFVKQKGLDVPIVWNTSGYETLSSIYALNDTVDIWLTDFKYASNDLASELSLNNVNNYVDCAMESLDAMASFCDKPKFDNFKENLRMTEGVIVRHMILPGQIQNSKDVLKMLFDEFENTIKYSIMNQYTPVIDKKSEVAKNHPELMQTVSQEDYEEVLNYADNLGIEDYYWQNGSTCSESFIPNWDL